MSPKHTIRNRNQGSTLVVALFTCLTVALVLSSFLVLFQSRHVITSRSTDWNSALPMAEAGVEEALTHLHDDAGAVSSNGWTASVVGGVSVITKQRTFSDSSYYSVVVQNASSSTPTIYSTGFVPAPFQANQFISRTVKAGATNSPTVFTHAIAATGTVTLSGSAVVDGYDSRLGPYDASTNRNASGGIETDSRATKAIDVGTGHVYGTVNTGPGGTISIGGGAVGDVAWNTSNSGIEPGYSNDTMNVSFPTNSPPTGSFLTPTVTTAGGSNITYIPSGSYQLSSFTSSDSTKPMIVTGKATLWVTGDFTVQGSGYVLIAPGASLTLYLGGTATVSGGGVVNGTQLPSNFSYIGLSSNSSFTYSGSAAFIGTINAPQASATISGSAGSYGAVICNSYNSSGGSGFHYDSSLAAGGGLVVTSWSEM